MRPRMENLSQSDKTDVANVLFNMDTKLGACQLATPCTCSRPWHVLEDLLEFHASEFHELEVEMSLYACTRDRHQSRSRRFEAAPFLRG